VFKYILIFLILLSCSERAKKSLGDDVLSDNAEPKTFKQIAPLTANALTGRKNLHENGWFFIPSTKKTIQQVSEEGRMTSLSAKAMLLLSLKKRATDFPGKLGDRMNSISNLGKKYENSMQELSKDIYSGTITLIMFESISSIELMKKSKDNFVLGYLSLIPTAKKDSLEIFQNVKDWNSSLGDNYKSLDELYGDTSQKSGEKISSSWRSAYSKAILEFDNHYKKSGEQQNSLLAVWDIFQGYTFALKELALSPLGETSKASGEFVLNKTILTGGYIATAVGQGIVSTGMVIYTPFKLGYRILSPTLESGFLGAMGIASAASTAPTAVGGFSLGAFNQVTAITAVQSTRVVAKTSATVYETGSTAAGMIYDIGKGTSKTVLYGLKSGIILSYTALTAIPSHLILTVPDGTIFLAWDGPRLVIANVRGNYKGYDDLPTGTIVDLEDAKKQGKVDIITDDEELIKKVLDKEIQDQENFLKAKEDKK
jgi:hypothetical protein